MTAKIKNAVTGITCAPVRMLFDWLITGQVAPFNPASAVRGPKHVVKTGKTPVLEGKEWRRLIDTIPIDTVRDLRDRALIATLTYGFARVGAALKMRVEDLQSKGTGWLIRLHEKGGKQHMMPCHHALAEALRTYIDAAGIGADKKGFLFRTSRGHIGTALSDQPMTQPDAWRMIRRRAAAVGIMAPIGNHSFRIAQPGPLTLARVQADATAANGWLMIMSTEGRVFILAGDIVTCHAAPRPNSPTITESMWSCPTHRSPPLRLLTIEMPGINERRFIARHAELDGCRVLHDPGQGSLSVPALPLSVTLARGADRMSP